MKTNQTKSIGTSRFSVRRWMFNIAVLAAAGSALAEVHYVDVNSANATPPYINWSTAATNIQDAVDAAVAGDEIVVTNGTYSPVYVNKPLNVRSVNGPQSSIIDGQLFQFVPCADLTSGASLSGFTLTGGYVDSAVGGAGVLCESATAVVSNCFVTGNYTYNNDGGGAYGGTLNNCTLYNNAVDYGSGGGAAYCTLNNCTLSGNSAPLHYFTSDGSGGGAYQCTLNNCTLTGNSAVQGGGATGGRLNNCTLTGNSASGNTYLGGGGGTYYSAVNNCIVYGNHALIGTNSYGGVLNYCCTTPQPFYGIGNITNAPLFYGSVWLQSNSPCINAGNNSYVTSATDLDGNPRIVGVTVDIGAYEYQSPVSMISYAWLQQFNLPINSVTDTADPDGDGVDNYHEWLAGTGPTNPFSSPAQLTIIPSGTNVVLTWSTNAVGFTLQSTTNLGSSAAWSTNSPAPVVMGGQNVIINPLTGPQQFYRLKQ